MGKVVGNGAYRTVRACKSTGAPETTAAGVVSPGSLPSRTRLGTGENVEVPWSIGAFQSGWFEAGIDGVRGSTCSATIIDA